MAPKVSRVISPEDHSHLCVDLCPIGTPHPSPEQRSGYHPARARRSVRTPHTLASLTPSLSASQACPSARTPLPTLICVHSLHLRFTSPGHQSPSHFSLPTPPVPPAPRRRPGTRHATHAGTLFSPPANTNPSHPPLPSQLIWPSSRAVPRNRQDRPQYTGASKSSILLYDRPSPIIDPHITLPQNQIMPRTASRVSLGLFHSGAS